MLAITQTVVHLTCTKADRRAYVQAIEHGRRRESCSTALAGLIQSFLVRD